MSALPPLNALRAFEAAARCGGFSAAAEELSVTPAAVGQQVRHLEEILGVTLFEREGRSLRLTDTGAAGLERLSRAMELMGEASTAMRSPPSGAALNLAAPADFSERWLAPRLPRFRGRHGPLTLTLTTDNPAQALEDGAADIAILYAAEPPTGLRAQRLMGETLTPLASGAAAADIQDAAGLDRAILIHDVSPDGERGPGWRAWLASRGAYAVDSQSGDRVSGAGPALALAAANGGVALARRTLAEAEMRSGALTPLFPDGDMAAPTAYFLVSRATDRLSETARRFADWLQEEAARFSDLQDEL